MAMAMAAATPTPKQQQRQLPSSSIANGDCDTTATPRNSATDGNSDGNRKTRQHLSVRQCGRVNGSTIELPWQHQ